MSVHFAMRVAERVIDAHCLYPETERFCGNFLYEGDAAPDFSVAISQEDIDFERERHNIANAKKNPVPVFSDVYLDKMALLRKIAAKMPDHDTMLLHGSAVAVDGQTYIFTARSGTGKSTHTRFWREYLGERAVMVNDDKPLIRLTDSGAFVCGDPWNGKHALGTNIQLPLKAICLLERSEVNRIETVDAKDVWPLLMLQIYRSNDPQTASKVIRLLDRMLGCVKLYRLGCNMSISAAELSYETMKG